MYKVVFTGNHVVEAETFIAVLRESAEFLSSIDDDWASDWDDIDAELVHEEEAPFKVGDRVRVRLFARYVAGDVRAGDVGKVTYIGKEDIGVTFADNLSWYFSTEGDTSLTRNPSTGLLEKLDT